jgi:hypothetical protein
MKVNEMVDSKKSSLPKISNTATLKYESPFSIPDDA